MLAARVVTAAVLIAALLAALFLLPSAWLAGLIAVLVGFAGFEWCRLCGLKGAAAWGYATAIAVIATVLALVQAHRAAFAVSALFWVFVAPAWLWRGVNAQQVIPLSIAGFIALAPTALAMVALPPMGVLLVLALVWVADSVAYFVGRAWGRRKLAPAISPGKTREGAAGGLIGALLYAIICGSFIEGIAWATFIAAATLLAMLSIIGDLFESALKRQAGAKDSGTLLPGHGGLLDRIDSVTSTLPLAALLWPVVITR